MSEVAFAPHVILQLVGGEALVVNLKSEVAFSLNETGARIAQFVKEGRPLAVIVNTLSEEYGRDREAIEDDVRALVRTLVAKDLVVVDGVSAR